MPSPWWKQWLDCPPRSAVALWFLFLTALGSTAAYFPILTGFSSWDDEGAMMMTVKKYLEGWTLYEQVPSGYGPVYYFYNGIVRALTGTPVTHDVVRISSLSLGALCALICSAITLQLTRSVLIASVTFVFALGLLIGFFRDEPGHPQELCILLLVCVVAAGIMASSARLRAVAMLLLGGLPAALLFIKANIGVYAIIAVALSVLFHSPWKATRLSLLAVSIAAMAALVLPSALMRIHLDDQSAQVYCLVTTISTAAVVVVLFVRSEEQLFSFRDCWLILLAFASTFTGVILVMMVQGVSWFTVLDSIVLGPFRVFVSQTFWYHPIGLHPIWTIWAVAGLTTAAGLCVMKTDVDSKPASALFSYGKLILGITAFLLQFGKSAAMLGFVTPLCWLLLFQPARDNMASQSFGRTILCVTAVIQTLYAYPISGSQSIFIKVLLMMVAAIWIGDFLQWVRGQYRGPSHIHWLGRSGVVLGPIFISVAYAAVTYQAYGAYRALPSLNLAGAQLIHVREQQAVTYQWLTRELTAYCDVFVGLPGIPSLYAWTSQDPPAGLFNAGWLISATDREQVAVADVLSAHPNACAVYNPDLVAFWNRAQRDMNGFPLARYIFENFKNVAMMNGYYFMVRKQRKMVLPGSPTD